MSRFTFSLRTFLLAVSLIGIASPMIYRRLFRPAIEMSDFTLELDPVYPPIPRVGNPQVLMIVRRGIFARELAFVIVMPSSTVLSMYDRWMPAPPEDGVGFVEGELYSNGKPLRTKHRRCYLVFNPFDGTYLEFPLEPGVATEHDVRSSSIWNDQVVPAARAIMLRQIGDMTSRSDQVRESIPILVN
jgi:hypothetical protein